MVIAFFTKIWLHAILSKKMRKFFEEKDITILDWSGNSPDLNPIENLWAIIERRIEKTECSTVQKLISAIVRT